MAVGANHPAKAGWSFVKPSVIPGFGLTFGYTLLYLSIIVLIPIIGLFLKAATISPEQIWKIASSARTLNALKISFGASLIAASRALDRVLLWNYYTVPAWTSTDRRFAFWDRFGRPEIDVEFGPSSTYMSGIAELWWSSEAEQ